MPPEIALLFVVAVLIGIGLISARQRHERDLADRVGRRMGESLQSPRTPDEDPVILLEKLQRLRERGAITDEEFEEQKARILYGG